MTCETFDRGDRVEVVDDQFGVPSDGFVGMEGRVKGRHVGLMTGRPQYAVVLDGRRDDDDELFYPEQLVLVGEQTRRAA